MVATDEVRRPGADDLEHAAAAAGRARTRSSGSPRARRPTAPISSGSSSPAPNGGRRVYGYEPPRRDRLTSGLVVRVQGIEAGFLARSYPVGGTATVGIATDAKRVRLQLFSFASLPKPTVHDLRTGGVAVAPAVQLAWPTRGSALHYVQISAAGVARERPLLPARELAGDGRVGYAPLILRPRTLGEHKVAVVLSTNTWQAYNFLDANGDGWGDSWYVGGASPTVDLRRPYLDFGVPFRFQRLGPELHLVAEPHRQAGRLPHRRRPRARRERRRAAARVRPRRLPRPRGVRRAATPTTSSSATATSAGDLMFLSANNFFWKVDALGSDAAARGDVAHARQARGGARRRAVVGLELRHLAGAVRRAGRDARRRGRSRAPGFATARPSGATGSRSTRARRARRPGRGCSRGSRTRSAQHDAEMTYYESAARARGSSPPARSTSPRRSPTRRSRGWSRTSGRRLRALVVVVEEAAAGLAAEVPSRCISSSRSGGAIRSSPSAPCSASEAWTWTSTPIRSISAQGPIGQFGAEPHRAVDVLRR